MRRLGQILQFLQRPTQWVTIFPLIIVLGTFVRLGVSSTFESISTASPTINAYDPEYGVFIGRLQGHEHTHGGAAQPQDGLVYAINDSAIQIINFTFSGRTPDAFFWLDSTERPTRDGVRLWTNEYGDSPIGFYPSESRVVLVLPEEQKLHTFRSLSLVSLNQRTDKDTVLASVSIPENLITPRSQFLPDELRAPRYAISGLVQIVDTRTIRIVGFSFEGQKAPDGYFFVGRGLNVTKETGVKVPIHGRDTFEVITPMSERYSGGKDVLIDLPNGYDIRHIDFLSIYCFNFDVDYAHVYLRNISRYLIPPHVPMQRKFTDAIDEISDEAWNLSNLLGTPTQLNFTFQLGPNGGSQGYSALHGVARPPRSVWYVNGYLANLYLKRGVTYNFIVEGGNNASRGALNNPLYLSNDSYGGYSKLSNSERQRALIYAPSPPDKYAGRLCRWSLTTDEWNSEEEGRESEKAGRWGNSRYIASRANEISEDIGTDFGSFVDFRAELTLRCEDAVAPGNNSASSPAIFQFTPGADTPNVLYFNSYHNFYMGSRIFVVDEFPSDLRHIVEEPYRYDARQHHTRESLTRENAAPMPQIISPSMALLSTAGFFLLSRTLLLV